MDERAWARVYQGAARGWLALAFASFLLPPADRVGIWLPLHLALAGAVTVAISGAILLFAQVLTAGPPHPVKLVIAQFALVNLGVAFAAAGFTTHHPEGVALGGTLVGIATLVLADLVRRSRRRGLNRRHTVSLFLYQAAIGCVLIGVVLGATMGTGVVHDSFIYLDLRRAHMVLNVMGWASLAIAATLITLFPTVLKVRMVIWRGRWPARILVFGVLTLASGLGIGSGALAFVGALMYTSGASAFVWMVVRTLRTERKHGVSVSARHMVAACAWWLIGAMGLAVTFLTHRFDVTAVDAYLSRFLLTFVLGWVVQTLLGTWLYVLPTWRPGLPQQRATWFQVMARGGWVQVLAFNAGLVILVVNAVPGPKENLLDRLTFIGWALVAVGAFMAIVKAALFPFLAHLGRLLAGRGEVGPPAERN